MSALAASSTALRPSAWRQALLLLGMLLLALLLLYRDTVAAMVGIWSNSNTFAHAFLVPPIALWLVWRMRASLARLQPEPQPWLLLPMLGASAVWLLGDMVASNAVTQLMFAALLVISVAVVLGLRITRELSFPLAFLFFMVPIGEFMLPTLMTWTADFTVAALRLSGVPVFREGQNFIIPSGAWSVIEACSGIRYMIASFMVGTLFAYLNYTSMMRRLAFCAVALLVPLLANWLRAYFIVMLGHLSNNRLAAGVDHLIYGWVFFGFIVMVMFLVGARWTQAPADPPALTVAPAAVPAQAMGRASLLAAASCVVLAWPHLSWWQVAPLDALPMPALRLPALPGTGEAGPEALVFEPVFVNPDAVDKRAYAVVGGEVAVHVAYYRHQVFGRKLVTSNNTLLRSNDLRWSRTAVGQAPVRIGDGSLALLSAELHGKSFAVGSSERERLDVRQVYWVDGTFTTSGALAGLTALLGRLNGRGDAAAMLTFYTLGEAQEQTRQRLDDFIGAHLGALQATLAAVRVEHQRPTSRSPGNP